MAETPQSTPYRALPPLAGLVDGLDPALPDAEYPPVAAPSLRNFRVGAGRWQTRAGMRWYTTLPVPANYYSTLLLEFAYTGSTVYGMTVRPQSGVDSLLFYTRTEPTGAWSQVTGAAHTGVVQQCQCVQYGTNVYLTDRSGRLIRWVLGEVTYSNVLQPIAPGAAPSVRPWTYGVLDNWADNNTAPYGWTESDNTNFNVTAIPASGSDFDLGNTREFTIGSDPRGDTISQNVSQESLNSHTIAFYVEQQSFHASLLQFQMGLSAANDFSYDIRVPKPDEAYPVFIPVGDLPYLNYKRFRVRKKPQGTRTIHVSSLMLPGRLDGQYRWIFTHYNPVTGAESAPSSISNNGVPLDLSVVGTNYRPETADAFRKSAMLDGASDAGSDSSTVYLRWYRNGGVPSLTKDRRGGDVWIRVGQTVDLATTLNGSATAADRGLVLTAIKVTYSGTDYSLAVGDWLVLERGTEAKREYVKVAEAATWTDLVIDAGTNTLVTSVLRPFTQNDVGRLLYITGGTGFTVANRTITAVSSANVATLSASAGTLGSTGGQANLKGINTSTLRVEFTSGLLFSHSSGVAAQIAFLDNTANESVDPTLRIDRERDDPPQAIGWVATAPDGRLFAAPYTGQDMGVAVSNKPTPDRPNDQEVFPDGVDPLTRQSPTQGWRFAVQGTPGDRIMWAGFFNGVYTLLSRQALYQVYAQSQQDWGPQSVVKLFDVGCLNGETVQQVNGVLYWVKPGPEVVRWSGGGQPEILSTNRVSEALAGAPITYQWRWFGRGRVVDNYQYYSLCLTPEGQTGNVLWLDYNVQKDAWETRIHYTPAGTAIPFQVATVQRASATLTDQTEQFFAAAGDGYVLGGTFLGERVYRLDAGDVDAGTVNTTFSNSPALGATSFTITSASGLATGDYLLLSPGLANEELRQVTLSGTTVTCAALTYAHTAAEGVQLAGPVTVLAQTKRFGGENEQLIELPYAVRVKGPSAADTVTLGVTAGGSEYGTVTRSYDLSLSGDATEKQNYRRLHRDLKGCWHQFQLSGNFYTRPVLRILAWTSQPIRVARVGE